MSNVTKWIVDWFVTECSIEESKITENLDNNYFEAGFIDSFKFITMVADAEDKFGIEFSNDQFEDRSFSTINGLAKIIEGLRNNGQV